MLSYLRSAKRVRRLAALASFLFAAWALAAALPHGHGGPAAPGAFSGPALFEMSTTASHVAGGCPLCDWLASSRLPLAPPPCLVLVPSLFALAAAARLLAGPRAASAPHRLPRAPPA